MRSWRSGGVKVAPAANRCRRARRSGREAVAPGVASTFSTDAGTKARWPRRVTLVITVDEGSAPPAGRPRREVRRNRGVALRPGGVGRDVHAVRPVPRPAVSAQHRASIRAASGVASGAASASHRARRRASSVASASHPASHPARRRREHRIGLRVDARVARGVEAHIQRRIGSASGAGCSAATFGGASGTASTCASST